MELVILSSHFVFQQEFGCLYLIKEFRLEGIMGLTT